MQLTHSAKFSTSQIKGRVVFEFSNASSVPRPRPHTLIFIAGLNDGLPTVPNVEHLAKALKPTQWSLFWVQLSSSYGAWSMSSLQHDVNEIIQCINFEKELKGTRAPAERDRKTVLMGHSTGCQDIMYYLTNHTVSHRQNSGIPDSHAARPVIDGAILQAPVSDREELHMNLQRHANPTFAWETYHKLVKLAKSQKPTDLVPIDMTITMGFQPDTPFNSYRFLSIASPDSPFCPSEDDMFSSDLPDEAFMKTFGRVGESGLLKGKLLVLFSECDEYVPEWVDKRALMHRWARVTDAGGRSIWDPASGLIPRAVRNVEGFGQDWLIGRVHGYLQQVQLAS